MINATEGIKPKVRHPWLDLGRIIAMFCVIGVHQASIGFHYNKFIDPSFSPWISSVFWLSFFKGEASTLFFMISGALLLQKEKAYSVSSSLSRSLNLILPLITWSVLYIFYYHFTYNFNLDFSNLLSKPAAYHFWFIYIMIGIYLSLPFIKIFFDGLWGKREIFKYFIVVFLCLTILQSLGNSDVLTTFGYDKVRNYVVYFLMGGMLFRLTAENSLYKSRKFTLLLVVHSDFLYIALTSQEEKR